MKGLLIVGMHGNWIWVVHKCNIPSLISPNRWLLHNHDSWSIDIFSLAVDCRHARSMHLLELSLNLREVWSLSIAEKVLTVCQELKSITNCKCKRHLACSIPGTENWKCESSSITPAQIPSSFHKEKWSPVFQINGVDWRRKFADFHFLIKSTVEGANEYE